MTSWPGLVRTEKKKSKWSGLKKTKQGDSLERIRMGLGWWRGQNTERKEKASTHLLSRAELRSAARTAAVQATCLCHHPGSLRSLS